VVCISVNTASQFNLPDANFTRILVLLSVTKRTHPACLTVLISLSVSQSRHAIMRIVYKLGYVRVCVYVCV